MTLKSFQLPESQWRSGQSILGSLGKAAGVKGKASPGIPRPHRTPANSWLTSHFSHALSLSHHDPNEQRQFPEGSFPQDTHAATRSCCWHMAGRRHPGAG